jgi:hypothetical protein
MNACAFERSKLGGQPHLEFCGIGINQGRLGPLQAHRRIGRSCMGSISAFGGIDDRDHTDTTGIGLGNEPMEAVADPGSNDLHAILLQLGDQSILLLFIHLSDADDVHADGDIARLRRGCGKGKGKVKGQDVGEQRCERHGKSLHPKSSPFSLADDRRVSSQKIPTPLAGANRRERRRATLIPYDKRKS